MRDDDLHLLEEIAGSLEATPENPEIRLGQGELILAGRPGGAVAHVLILLLLFGPPVLVVLEDQEVSNLLVALLWLVVMGRSVLSLLVTDIEATFRLQRRSLTVSNMNPLHLWLRRWGLGFPHRWEGDYDWSRLGEIQVSYKVHTRALQGYLVSCKADDGRRVPIAEFKEQRTAEQVAAILRTFFRLDPNSPES